MALVICRKQTSSLYRNILTFNRWCEVTPGYMSSPHEDAETTTTTPCNSTSRPVITVFTKDECCLCDDAKKSLSKYKDRVVIEEIDIVSTGNDEWLRRYRFDIPVVHLNGRFIMKHRFSDKILEDNLKTIEQQSKTRTK